MQTDWSRVYALGISLLALVVLSLYAFSFAFNAHTTVLLMCGYAGLVVAIPIAITLAVKIVRELDQ